MDTKLFGSYTYMVINDIDTLRKAGLSDVLISCIVYQIGMAARMAAVNEIKQNIDKLCVSDAIIRGDRQQLESFIAGLIV